MPAAGAPASVPAVSHPFERYVAPARCRPALWRLGLGVAMVVLAWLAAMIALQAALAALGTESPWWDRITRADHPAGMLVLLSTFAAPLAGALLAARLLHGRSPVGLLGPPRAAARDFGRAVASAAAVYAVVLVLWAVVHDSVPGLPVGVWLLYLLPGLAALLLQTGAEEVVFRGYLQGQLAARFRSPLAWALGPSLLFGAIHYDPSLPGPNAVIAVAATTVFGLLAADLTARTGTLGAAWGLHFANNVAALLVLGYPDALSGLALRLVPYHLDDPVPPLEVVLTMAGLLGAWALIARATRRP